MNPQPVSDAGELRYIVDVLRALVEQEFKYTERISTRARQALVVASAFVTLTQSIAFGSFRAAHITKVEQVVLVVSALTAILLLIVAGVTTVKVDADDASAERDVNPDLLTHLAEALASGNDITAFPRLARAYRTVLDSRREANRVRAQTAKFAARWVSYALLAAAAEVAIALLVRL